MTSDRAETRSTPGALLPLVLSAALMAACAAPGETGRLPTSIESPTGATPAAPPAASYSISGVLTLRTASGTVPLANTGVGAYVIMTNGSSHGMTPVTTDANGRYQFANVPNGQVVVQASAPHAYQVCAAIATVSGANGVMDVELVDSAALRSVSAANAPTLSGSVYRSTGAGPQPIAGALIEFEYAPVIAATTITDAQGRYTLCRLPTGRGGLDIWFDGVAIGGSVVNITGNQVLDINVRP